MTQAETTENNKLVAGDYAPEFTMNTDNGGTVALSDLEGKNVVLYFYPKDDTPGCTKEAQAFAIANKKFADTDTVIIGVSKDSTASHDKFKNKFGLPFTLASDETITVCEAYDCWVEKNMYGKKYMGIQRDTFLIGKDGKILKIWRKVKVDKHADAVLEAVNELC